MGDSANINAAALVYNPNGTGSSKVKMQGGTFNADPGNKPGNIAAGIYGPGEMTMDDTKVSVGTGAVSAAAAKGEEESELQLFLSGILTVPPPRMRQVVKEMEEELGIYKPEDVFKVNLDDLNKVVKGAQFTRLKEYIEREKLNTLHGTPKTP